MLLSFIGQITNWNNQIVLIHTITKMASYALQQLALFMYLLTIIGYLKKKHYKSALTFFHR